MGKRKYIYLGRIFLNGYEPTVLDTSEAKVTKALQKEYYNWRRDNAKFITEKRTWKEWIDYSTIEIHELEFGKVEWL